MVCTRVILRTKQHAVEIPYLSCWTHIFHVHVARNKGSLRRSRSSNSCSQSTTSTRKRRREGGKMPLGNCSSWHLSAVPACVCVCVRVCVCAAFEFYPGNTTDFRLQGTNEDVRGHSTAAVMQTLSVPPPVLVAPCSSD